MSAICAWVEKVMMITKHERRIFKNFIWLIFFFDAQKIPALGRRGLYVETLIYTCLISKKSSTLNILIDDVFQPFLSSAG